MDMNIKISPAVFETNYGILSPQTNAMNPTETYNTPLLIAAAALSFLITFTTVMVAFGCIIACCSTSSSVTQDNEDAIYEGSKFPTLYV